MAARKSLIPETTLIALRNYIDHGLRPGAFLEAVLRDDLYDTIDYADEQNLLALKDIVRAVNWATPGDGKGSAEAIEKWIEHKTAERMDYAL